MTQRAAETFAHRPFDASEYLTDAETQIAAINEAFSTENPKVILSMLRAVAQAIEARQGQDAQRLDRNDESAVGNADAPKE